MSQFNFLHEINDFVYAIEDCNSGSADAIKRGEVISLSYIADETGTASSFNAYTMTYNIRFDGDTFTTAIEVPFNVLAQISLTEALDETSYGGSPSTEGTFAPGGGYSASDVITLSDGSVITVDTVATVGSPEVTGGVTEFTVTTKGGQAVVGTALTQFSSDGAGVGFTLTPGSGTVDDDGFRILETETDSTIFAEKADAVVAYAALLA